MKHSNSFCLGCSQDPLNVTRCGKPTCQMIERDRKIAALEQQVKDLSKKIRELDHRTVGMCK